MLRERVVTRMVLLFIIMNVIVIRVKGTSDNNGIV